MNGDLATMPSTHLMVGSFPAFSAALGGPSGGCLGGCSRPFRISTMSRLNEAGRTCLDCGRLGLRQCSFLSMCTWSRRRRWARSAACWTGSEGARTQTKFAWTSSGATSNFVHTGGHWVESAACCAVAVAESVLGARSATTSRSVTSAAQRCP